MKFATVLIVSLILGGCSTVLPRAGTTAVSTATGCIAGGPVGCVGGAVLGDVAGDLIFREPKKAEEEKVDTFYDLVIKLGEITGWTVAAVALIPFFLGYVMPQPGSRRRRYRDDT